MAKSAAASSNRAKAKAKAPAKKGLAKVEKPGSALQLVEAEERADAQRPVAKRLRRRNTEETVTKCIRDNFSGWDASQTDHFLVDGKSLREELTTERRMANSGDPEAPKFGKRYYELKRQRFSPANTPSKRLKAHGRGQDGGSR